MIKAVVFDLGETLVDESRLWRMWAEWLHVPDHVLFAVLGAVIGRGEHHHRTFELLRPGFVLEQAREERRKAGIPDRFSAEDLYPDVPACLTELRKRGLLIGIAGNQPAGIGRIIRDLGVSVDFIAPAAQWKLEKPSAAFFEKIARELTMAPESVAYVGDRLDNDILPALSVGMIPVFIRRGPWGFLHAQRPEAACARIRLESLSELPAALDRLRPQSR
jgi:FMN phosphatase YigB (HAD superfamily)